MTPLIDGDILLHEIGWSGQFKDKETKEEILLPFEHVQELLDQKIKLICEDVNATELPIIFLTNNEWLTEHINRANRYTDEEKCVFVPNFRYDVAKTKPYKGTRKNPKPFHFKNISAYLLAEYNVVVSRGGLEADDMMCLYQTSNDNTIICSRDKDLNICPGWHFSWECGNQRAIGPHYTDEVGEITLHIREMVRNKKVVKVKEIKGYGLKFFFTQMLIGDAADNIPGLPKVGVAKAWEVLSPCDTEKRLYQTVKAMYMGVMEDKAKEYFMEQMELLWMKQKDKPLYKFKEE